MKLSVTRDSLHTGMGAVSATIPTKTTLPVLSNILLDAKGRVKIADFGIAKIVGVAALLEPTWTSRWPFRSTRRWKRRGP